jgi:K+-transporting ATPase A subunit
MYTTFMIHIYTQPSLILVSKAIAMFLQSKAWGIRNAYKHGTSVDVFESASERRGADGIDARA